MLAKLVLDCKNRLGESCFWDPRSNTLWWTDIEGSSVYRMSAVGTVTRTVLPGRAGFILPRAQEGFVIGFPNLVAVTNRDLTTIVPLYEIEPDLPTTRINDAKIDPYGGVVFGTFDETPSIEDRRPIGGVYRMGPDESLTRLFGDVTVSNGLAFSPKGDIMYFADTADGRIRRFHIGPNFESIDELDPLAAADAAPGLPDGAAVDSKGNYWNARVWGGCVVRFTPEGVIDAKVDVPVRAPTCVTLGGPALDELFITSLRIKHTEAELAETPEAGGIFSIKTDVPGIRQAGFAI